MMQIQELPRLEGRKIVVSGAGGGGIGTAITRLLARAGATVIAVDAAAERLDSHLETLYKDGHEVVPVGAVRVSLGCVGVTPDFQRL